MPSTCNGFGMTMKRSSKKLSAKKRSSKKLSSKKLSAAKKLSSKKLSAKKGVATKDRKVTHKVFPLCRKGSNPSVTNPKHAKSLKQILSKHIRDSDSTSSPKIKKAALNLFKALSKNKKCSLVQWRTDKEGHRYLRQSYKRKRSNKKRSSKKN